MLVSQASDTPASKKTNGTAREKDVKTLSINRKLKQIIAIASWKLLEMRRKADRNPSLGLEKYLFCSQMLNSPSTDLKTVVDTEIKYVAPTAYTHLRWRLPLLVPSFREWHFRT